MLARVQAEKQAKQPPYASAGVTMASPTAAKIALFRNLFRGREDVLPRRWEYPKTGKAGLRAHVPERMGPRSLRKAAG